MTRSSVVRHRQRFAVAPPIAESGTSASHVMLYFNFLDELRRVVPVK
jgi:hypothetical protein